MLSWELSPFEELDAGIQRREIQLGIGQSSSVVLKLEHVSGASLSGMKKP
jgi:hypothetical protein